MFDTSFIMELVQGLAYLFVFVVGSILLLIIIIFIIDKTQTKQAIRHNYPVVGRFRYLFEEMGVFFRQYFFAMDREELPFNRAERSWVYCAAKDTNNTVAFGSTRDLRLPRTILLKAVRVKNYVTNMVKEVGLIAHSCGVDEPRKLERFHARMVVENGRSLPLNEIYDLDKYL